MDGEEEVKQETVKAITSELSNWCVFTTSSMYWSSVWATRWSPWIHWDLCTASKVKVTRHMFVITGAESDRDGLCERLIPGVMPPGMESAELIRSAVEIAKPEVVIAVDAFARNVDRISSTIQITDTGISPGARNGKHEERSDGKIHWNKGYSHWRSYGYRFKTLILDNLAGYLKKPEEAERHIERTVTV